jgi:uncharacterized protein involved in exopolysaccharide biosynthesis
MLLATRSASVRLLAGAAAIGAIAAGAVSFTMPRRYISTAVMRLAPPTVAGEPAWQIEAEAAHRLREMRTEILSPRSLAGIIQRPAIDLYRQERATRPMEDVIEDMRRDVGIELVPAPAPGRGRTPPSFRLSFEYPDRVKAQAVVRQLTARLSEFNDAAAVDGLVEVLASASLPEKPSQPDRLAIVAIGLGVGLAIGILFAFLHRRGLKWTLRVTGCAVAGLVLATAISLLMPEAFADGQKSYQFVGLGAFAGVVCGIFLLRVRSVGGSRYARLIAFCAAGGAIAASFALPERYVATAAMRIFPSQGGAAPLEIEPAERLREIAREVLSRGSLSELIQRPSLDLYRQERSRRPMEDIVDDMRRRDIRIAPTPPPGLTGLRPAGNFQISFEYADRHKAQAVVLELAKKFVEVNVTAERTPHGETMPGGLGLEVAGPPAFPAGRPAAATGLLSGESDVSSEHKPDREMSGSLVLGGDEPASLPASPVSPNRPVAAAIGLLAGILLGSLLALRGWLVARQAATPGPHPSYWKYTLAAAAVGTVAAGLGSFAIPNRYLSMAVLRVVPFHVAGAGAAQAEIEYTARLNQLTEGILSRGSLAELIQRPSLDLYPMGRRWRPMEDIVDNMRRRDLRIAPTETTGFAGSSHLISFQISFEYADRDKAQAVVRELTTKFTEGIVAADRSLLRDKMPGSLALEVVDPATLPGSPVSPNRPAIAAIGLLAGILLGPFLALRHKPGVRSQPAGIGRPSYWKYAVTAAALGAIAASLGSLAFPNRYVSTAVLRLVSTDPRSAASAGVGEHTLEMLRPVLSRDSLAEIIQRPELQLYATERRRHSLDEAIQQMRDRDLRVTPLRDYPLGGRPTAFRISFEYSDAAKAYSSVQALVAKFMERAVPEQFVTLASTAASQRRPAPAYLEVLDTASMPERPVSPNREAIGAAGCLAGLLLGLAIARLRRRAPHSAPA